MMADTLLHLKNISKSFPGVQALNNADIEVNYGEIHALVGENGAGKSTLMKILSGVYASGSYDGQIIFKDKVQNFHAPRHSEQVGIEMIYQEINLILDLSVAENIFAGNYPTKNGFTVRWEDMFTRAKQAMERLGLEVDPKEKVRNLSTSKQQLISIAKAVNKNPTLLVLDEPTSTLTEKESDYLFSIIKNLREEGISSIYISHKLDEVFQIADRVTVLRDGEKIGTRERRGGFDRNEIVTMMVGRTIESIYPKKKVPIGEELLQIEALTVPHKFIKMKKLVDDASFTLRRGEILGLAGLVGAGRSELVNAIFGYIRREEGCRIIIEGEEVQIDKPKDAIEHGMALVSEDRRATGLITRLTIRENITLVSLRSLFSKGIINLKRESEQVRHYKERLQIKAPSVETKVRNLSGGNQQKVVLSKWLMNKPKILFLDEPTRGIDVGAKYEMYTIMTQLVKEGMGIVMISSELSELIGMCDRFLVLAEGKFVKALSREEADDRKIMHAATGGT